MPVRAERSAWQNWLRAVVAYDGTDFKGFQAQRSRRGQHSKSGRLRTVQGALEDALAQILQKPTSLLAAGRTDSGVHAIGQVVAFGTDWDRPLAELQRALNAVLPDDVAVLALSEAACGFHPRYDALGRTYRYTIWNHPVRCPLFRRTALWVRQPLDLAAMNQAAKRLVGSHDLGTFGTAPRPTLRKGDARAGSSPVQPTTVRDVNHAAWTHLGEPHPGLEWAAWQQAALDESLLDVQWQGLVAFTIEANAFLYHMVRSIVGTLLEVGLGDRTVSEFSSALYGVDRALAGPTAAPHGLCLMQVRYPGKDEH